MEGHRRGAPGGRINEIGRAIQEHAEANGFSVVRAFVGHGVGETFHTAPSVPHFYDPHSDTVIEAGMTFTIEPMINEGSWELGRIWPDGWTAPTRDGSRSAQFEHSLLVTPTGVEVLTLLPGGHAMPDRPHKSHRCENAPGAARAPDRGKGGG